VTLADGSLIDYGKLLLATGSAPRRLPLPGADAQGVLYLPRVGDSDRFRTTLQTATWIAVIGAGWIGLEVGNGIVVDAGLRSSEPDIYAAGNVANAYHPLLGRHVRVEHWANALNQPQAAARAMLGQDVAYDVVPYFYTDQYDLGMEYAGDVEPGGYDRVVFRGDVEGREFVAFWLRGGRVLAGMNVNIWDVNEMIQAIVRGGRTVAASRLADPGAPLDDFA
jgi:NADPH-dependent 2,4-dienoyl-CoA reductase/sulfur reductase-like enzyme